MNTDDLFISYPAIRTVGVRLLGQMPKFVIPEGEACKRLLFWENAIDFLKDLINDVNVPDSTRSQARDFLIYVGETTDDLQRTKQLPRTL